MGPEHRLIKTLINYVQIMALRALKGDSGSDRQLAAAAKYARDMGARVVNFSFSSNTEGRVLRRLREAVVDSPDVLFIAVAGNDAESVGLWAHRPCTFRTTNLICVTATDQDDELAVFKPSSSDSERGANYSDKQVHMAAPGDNMLVAQPLVGVQGFRYAEGTSFAAPITSGVAALAFSYRPEASVADVLYALQIGGRFNSNLVGKTKLPVRLDAFETLRVLDVILSAKGNVVAQSSVNIAKNHIQENQHNSSDLEVVSSQADLVDDLTLPENPSIGDVTDYLENLPESNLADVTEIIMDELGLDENAVMDVLEIAYETGPTECGDETLSDNIMGSLSRKGISESLAQSAALDISSNLFPGSHDVCECGVIFAEAVANGKGDEVVVFLQDGEVSVNFSASGAGTNCGNIRYEWDFGNGDKGNGQNLTNIYKEPGSYVVTLTAVCERCGNTKEDKIKVAVVGIEVTNINANSEGIATVTSKVIPESVLDLVESARLLINGVEHSQTPAEDGEITLSLDQNVLSLLESSNLTIEVTIADKTAKGFFDVSPMFSRTINQAVLLFEFIGPRLPLAPVTFSTIISGGSYKFNYSIPADGYLSMISPGNNSSFDSDTTVTISGGAVIKAQGYFLIFSGDISFLPNGPIRQPLIVVPSTISGFTPGASFEGNPMDKWWYQPGEASIRVKMSIIADSATGPIVGGVPVINDITLILP